MERKGEAGTPLRWTGTVRADPVLILGNSHPALRFQIPKRP